MDHREIIAAAHQAGVRLVRFEYCDVSGVARTKAIHVDQLEHKLVEGVSLTRAQMSINMLEQVIDIEGMEPVGEIRLVPDPTTFSVLPWVPGSASILCDQLDHDRTDWGACPRSYLKAMIERAAGHGITVMASFENEYYLAREADGAYVPFDFTDHAPVYARSATTSTPSSWWRWSTPCRPRGSSPSRRSTSTAPASRRSRSATPTRWVRPTTR